MKDGNKRVNLTISPDIYDRLQAFKKKYGIDTDASAAKQLIVRQLISLEQAEAYTEFMKALPPEKIVELATKGTELAKERIDNGETLEQILEED